MPGLFTGGWSSQALKLWVTITAVVEDEGGFPVPQELTFDVVSASAEYHLNTIPRAVCQLAVGRNVEDVNQAALIHEQIDTLAIKLRAEIFLQVTNPTLFGALLGIFAGIVPQWPTTPIRIFDGYTTGGGYQRGVAGAEYTLHLEHWLADLAFSSSVSSELHPANPADLTLAGLLPNKGTGATTGLDTAGTFINAGTIRQDFWGQGLKRYLEFLASGNAFKRTSLRALLGFSPDSDPTNADALRALARIEPSANGYVNGVPSALQSTDPQVAAALPFIADNMSKDAAAITVIQMAGHTLWDKLAGGYTGQYLLAVVPRTETALMVPFVPALRTAWRTIGADEYDFVRLSGDMPRILKAMVIFGGKQFQTGAGTSGSVGPVSIETSFALLGVGGYYGPPNASGQILCKTAPAWMANIPLQAITPATLGIPRVIANALFPGIGGQPLNQAPIMQTCGKLMTSYAQALYIQHMLQFRTGELSGRLRFDIAPGSTVAIEVAPELFLGLTDQLGDVLYATVLGCGWHLDAETPRAGSTYELAYVRNQADNQSDATSIAQHPLWKDSYAGAKLVDI